jgi:hypothetical protein
MAKKDLTRMSVAQLTAEYEKNLKEELIRAIENVEGTVKAMISECAAEVIGKNLGMKRLSYGSWEISRYHTDGKFADLVTNHANTFIEANGDALVKTYMARLTKEDTSELKEYYKTRLYEMIEEKLETKAQEDSEAIFAKLTGVKPVSDDVP